MRARRSKIEVASYKGKRFGLAFKVILALMLAGALTFATLLGAVLSGAYDHISGEPQVMIVLGCQVKEDGPSILLRDRLDEALNYLEDHPDLTVVVSGGQGPDEPTSEAQAMADYLIANGVDGEKVLLETASHNTAQNFAYSKKQMDEAQIDYSDGILVVSNGFHLTRARMLAQRAGFEEVYTLAAPTSHLPSRLHMYIREPLALVKSFVFDR
ncbi:YdcF family protein [Muriventricola aceti]|mgnify:FL=1|uniref:YdcF family protein n=1 Tax=Muriventricola aceti TaxID=2981773 RepID=UPI00082033E5|nr:YdcF family protein [Muriventricola aceti]MCU6703728.1 YdcF family protein [Muriventricola aceti]SCJ57949.1 DUF218 domain [uncultured Flavonifractor sp.]